MLVIFFHIGIGPIIKTGLIVTDVYFYLVAVCVCVSDRGVCEVGCVLSVQSCDKYRDAVQHYGDVQLKQGSDVGSVVALHGV